MMEDLRDDMEKQLSEIEKYINLAEKRLRKSKGIEKRVVCTSTRKNGYQYYFMEEGKRIYVKSKDMDLIRKIVQKNYDEAVHNELLKMRYHLTRFLKLYDIDQIKNVYSKLAGARKPLVIPLISTDEQYIDEWYETHKGGQNTYPDSGIYMTARGEEVRSKSEKIIADLFDKYNVPYCYEPKLELLDDQVVYPDFVVLNVRRRKTLYWEHFGLISDGEYAKKTCRKLNLYEENGYSVGKDILFSMESETRPLNIKQIEKAIKMNLL